MVSVGVLVVFEIYMAVFGVWRGPRGFVTPLRFKWFDSQPDSSNMGPVPIDFYDFPTFQKSQDGFLTRYLSCFRAGASKFAFSRFSVGTKKNRDEKLRRFVVVSPREVPSLPLFMPIYDFRFLVIFESPSRFHVPVPPKKCTLIVSVNRKGSTLGPYTLRSSGLVPADCIL